MNPSAKLTKKEVVTAFRTREILAAARRVLERQGLEAVTMEEIAASAGVAKGTIYLYFEGKDDLIQAILSQLGDDLLTDLEAVLKTPGPPRDKLHRVVTMLLNFLERERVLFPVYAQDLPRRDRPATGRWAHIRGVEEKILALLARLFAEGIEAGQFMPANPRLLTFLLRGLVRAVGYYQMDQVAQGKSAVAKEALPVLLNFLFSGLTPAADAPSGEAP